MTIRKLCFFKWLFRISLPSWPFMARQSTSLMNVFENDDKAFYTVLQKYAHIELKQNLWDRQPSTSLPDCLTPCLTTLPLFVFTWWEDFLKISWKCVDWEVESFNFRLNGWQQYCTRNYEKKCNRLWLYISCRSKLIMIIPSIRMWV